MRGLSVCVGLVLLALTPSSNADNYCRSRAIYATSYRTTYAPTYYAPAHVTPAYKAPSYEYVAPYLKTVLYPSNPDYYSSSESYYRDKVLLDAFAGKLSEALKKDREQAEYQSLKEEVLNLRRQLLYGPQQPMPQAPPPPQQQYQPQAPPEQAAPPQKQPIMPPAVGKLPPVPEGLQAIVTASCIRCHGATNATAGGGYDFQNLAAIPRDLRLLMKADVDDGHMPRGGKPLDDRAAALFHQYATGRSGTASAQK